MNNNRKQREKKIFHLRNRNDGSHSNTNPQFTYVGLVAYMVRYATLRKRPSHLPEASRLHYLLID